MVTQFSVHLIAFHDTGRSTHRSFLRDNKTGESVWHFRPRQRNQNLLDFVREGDELVITRVDRLARSIRDLQNIVYELDQKGVVLSATEQPIDTRTSAGKCFLDMLSVFAEFEITFAINGRWNHSQRQRNDL